MVKIKGQPLHSKTRCIDIFVNCNWVDTRWQQYSTHLHTNNRQNNTINLGRVRTVPGAHLIIASIGPRAELDVFRWEKHFSPLPTFEPISPSQWHSNYTDYVVPVFTLLLLLLLLLVGSDNYRFKHCIIMP